jgi:CRISPR/Cas system-associated exonuclease Cas4 (RecB family)
MVDLITPIYKQAEARIKRYPCKSNRASSIGYFVPELNGCIRRGVYERTHWQERELHSVKTQLVFDEGNEQERWVLKKLLESGIDIIEQQTPYEWLVYEITGHIDGKVIDATEAIPIEIKSMHPSIFDSIHCFEDFKKKPWTRAYMAQITIYMLCQGIDRAIFILKNKSTGEIKQIEVGLDYELGEFCLKTCEQINQHIKNNTLPERIQDREVCKDCPFKLTCLPDIQLGPELKIQDDPIFEQRIDSYLKLNPVKLECEKIWDTIKTEAKNQAVNGELNMIVGKYRITGKLDAKKAFRVSIENCDSK